jgi:hypothetical protein
MVKNLQTQAKGGITDFKLEIKKTGMILCKHCGIP